MTTRQKRKRLQQQRRHRKVLIKKRQERRVRAVANRLLESATPKAMMNLQSVTDVYGKVTFFKLP